MKYLLPLVFFTLITCTNKSPEEIILQPSFENIIQGELLNIKDDCINQLRVYDTVLLCVVNERCSDKALHLYSLNNLKILAEFGRKGNGPEEFNLPILMPAGSYPDGLADIFSIWIQDVNHKRFKLFHLKDVLEGNYMPAKTLFIEAGLLDGFGLNFVNKDKVIGEDHQAGKGLYFSYDLTKSEKSWAEYEPKPDVSRMPKRKIPIIYTVRTGYNKSLQTTVVAYRFFNRVGFYNKSDQLFSSVLIGDPVIPDFSQKAGFFVPDNVKIYFISLYTSQNYIYGLLVDAPQKQIMKDPDSIKSKIIILDWNQNLVNAFSLDHFTVSFTIDEKNKCLYGVSNTKEGFSQVYRYKFGL